MSDDFVAQVEGVSALAEPARRALYLFVAGQAEPVSREQAAVGTGVAPHTAKFHLDKLVEEGLLDTEFRRLSGRQGPGAGRPAKLYRRSARQLAVSLPSRQYRLAGDILARALEDDKQPDRMIPPTVAKAAHEAGTSIGARARAEGVDQAGGSRLEAVAAVLATQGYEPRIDDATITLANCPFHALSREHTALVCGMNLELISGVTTELGL